MPHDICDCSDDEVMSDNEEISTPEERKHNSRMMSDNPADYYIHHNPHESYEQTLARLYHEAVNIARPRVGQQDQNEEFRQWSLWGNARSPLAHYGEPVTTYDQIREYHIRIQK